MKHLYGLLLLFVVLTGTFVQAEERVWEVTCGLPQQDNPLLDLMPAGYSGPFPGDTPSGHHMIKSINRPHPEGTISGEMWILSQSSGWWMMKSIRVHPDDVSKFDDQSDMTGIHQIIESPFLSEPAIIRSWIPGDEELVNGQILALLPPARLLKCIEGIG